jgi:hypothetical protein
MASKRVDVNVSHHYMVRLILYTFGGKKAYFRTCVLMSVSYAHPTHCPICDLLVLMKTYSPIDLSSLPLPRISLSNLATPRSNT